jgi:hypothetical protein
MLQSAIWRVRSRVPRRARDSTRRPELTPRGHRLIRSALVLGLVLLGLVPLPARAAGGLVAAYAFDEAAGNTLSDASGNGNTGTISGATWTSGRYSYGLAFNGSSARVNVQDAPSLDLTSAMTL